MCSCGASDHITTDENCPNHHVVDEKFFKKIKGKSLYHAKRADKASTFKIWKQYTALYLNNTSNVQSPINDQKDKMDGNGYNNKQLL